MKRIALYARKSVERPDSVSIAAQIEKCRQVSPPGLPFEEYIDEGFSGKSLSRPAFEKMLSGIRAGEISHVVSYRLDRISRSITDFAASLPFSKNNGINTFRDGSSTQAPPWPRHVLYRHGFRSSSGMTIAERIADNYRFPPPRRFTVGNAPWLPPVKCILDANSVCAVALPNAPALFESSAGKSKKRKAPPTSRRAERTRAKRGK